MLDRPTIILDLLATIALSNPPIQSARIAAAIVHKRNIISIGFNQKKSHPFQAKFGKNSDSIFLHAETCAIKNSLRLIEADQLSQSSLYICRIKFTDSSKQKMIWGLSKPCIGCMRAIASFNIKNVIYSLDGRDYTSL